MAQPVWILSVDLQTKTAVFQSGLADAAKAARGSFTEIKSGAGEMGGEVGFRMTEARHSVMMLGEEFGIHLPRALAGFIAGLGPLGPALEAAFPFLAIAGLATILIEKLVAMHEAGEKLTADQIGFLTTANNAFNSLDQKLLQAGIRADELRNDHLGVLQKQLQLIDMQSLSDLAHQFDELDKAAMNVMKDLEGHWYTIGAGSDGAKHALDVFKDDYENLLSLGKKEEATGLLKGTLDQALKTQEALKTYRDNSGGIFTAPKEGADIGAALRAYQVLHAAKLSGTQSELDAQNQIVSTLQKQVEAETRLETIKNQDKKNTQTRAGNEASARASAAARSLADSQTRMGQEAITADKTVADAQNEIQQASLETWLATSLDFAGRTRDLELASNAEQIAALDRSGKDYQNQLKALQQKNLEIQAEYSARVTELTATSGVAVYQRDLQQLQQAEREKIQATQQGSAARLAAINAAINTEEDKNLQSSEFYRELLTQRVQTTRQMAEQEAQVRQQLAQQEAQSSLREQILINAGIMDSLETRSAQTSISGAQRLAIELQLMDKEYQIERDGLQKQLSALDKYAKDYEAKKRSLNDKIVQLDQENSNKQQAATTKAQQDELYKLTAGQQRVVGMFNQGFAEVLTGKQTFAQMMNSIDSQLASQMIQNALKDMEANDMTRPHEAAAAARKAFLAGWHFPFPANIVAAPVLAAGAFTAAMAFQSGTDSVPGVGRGDIVPTMLEPGEGVVSGGVMDGLRKVAQQGGFDQKAPQVTHVHYRPNVQALDADGVDHVLEKHADVVGKHVANHMRKRNK